MISDSCSTRRGPCLYGRGFVFIHMLTIMILFLNSEGNIYL